MLIKTLHLFLLFTSHSSIAMEDQEKSVRENGKRTFHQAFQDKEGSKEGTYDQNKQPCIEQSSYTAAKLELATQKNKPKYPFALLEEGAKAGHAHANYALGMLHKEGKGVEKDKLKASYFFMRAADKEHPDALYQLGQFSQSEAADTLKPRPLSRSHLPLQLQAHSYFHRAAAKGHFGAMVELARRYLIGTIGNKDLSKAEEFYEQAAKVVKGKGHAEALYKLGKLSLLIAFESNPDNEKVINYHAQAHDYFDRAATQGHLNAIIELAQTYIEGKIVNKDALKAEELYEQAAKAVKEKVHANILYKLGKISWFIAFENREDNVKVRNYHDQAHDYFDRAAAQGHLDAMTELAQIYLKGEFVNKDIHKAEKLYEQAAEGGHVRAAMNLAKLYEKGDILPQNYQKTIKLYEIVASKDSGLPANLTETQHLINLGWYYYKGLHGLPQDFRKSSEYFHPVLLKMDSTALDYLPEMYEKGLGVPQDFAKAAQCERMFQEEDD